MRNFIILFLFFLGINLSVAEVRLPAIIGSHMVLQQNAEVKLWGWCNPGEKITVTTSWDGAKYETTGENSAKWLVKVKTPKAGGPFNITIKGSNEIVLEDVLIGEVWICSGQSNMEWSGTQKLKQSLDEAPKATNKNIRLFYVAKSTSEHKQEDVHGAWKVNNPEDMKRFSAIGYFFGKKLNEELNVPIGLINSNWGGTPAEAWTPKDSIENSTELKAAAAALTPRKGWPTTPGLAYNAMIYPISNYNIAGAIWYQGESNTETSKSYKPLFSSMIGSWRQSWDKDFPFYYVQIAPYDYKKGIIGPLLREAQTRTLEVPNTGMVVISDLVTNVKDIHPENKLDVGLRLAGLALTKTYNKEGEKYLYPLYESYKVEKNKIRVFFNNLKGGLEFKGESSEFYIAGEDKVFVPAKAKISGNSVIVWADSVSKPVAVRFGFTNTAIPNLFSKEGLPVNIFRTDNWDVNTVSQAN